LRDIADITDPIQAAAEIAATIADLADIIGDLFAEGARHFLVPNLPDLARVPEMLGNDLATMASLAFNAGLESALAALELSLPGIEIDRLNLFALFEAIADNPGGFGFTNITTPCLNLSTGAVCADPSSHLFFDEIHPTAAGHRLIAQAALQALDEPASIALVSLALLALGFAARRR